MGWPGRTPWLGAVRGFAETEPPRHQEHQGIIGDEPQRRKERKDRYYLLGFAPQRRGERRVPIIMVSALSALSAVKTASVRGVVPAVCYFPVVGEATGVVGF